MKVRKDNLIYTADEVKTSRVAIYNAGVTFEKQTSTKAQKEVLKSYGFGNDANKFYPALDVKNDVIPKPEDFIQSPWRLLSATIVGAYSWKATDFTNEAVLKQAVQLLDKKPIYQDHDFSSIDNWVGIVNTPKWSPSYIDSKGEKVPAGINGIMNIDAKTNPKIARGVLSNIITSNSVTVLFDWIPSHEFDDEWEFERAVGTVIDGKMVTRVVIKIHDFFETSLVWMGADPYSKKIDEEGKLINVDTTGIHVDGYNKTFDKEDEKIVDIYKNKQSYHIISAVPKCLGNSCKKINMEKQLEEALRLKLGIAEDGDITVDRINGLELADEKLVEFTKDLKEPLESYEIVSRETLTEKDSTIENLTKDLDTSKDSLTKLTTELNDSKEATTSLNGELETIKIELSDVKEQVTLISNEKVELESLAKTGSKYISMQKDEAIRLYKLSVDEADESVVELFKSASEEQLLGLIKQHTQGVVQKFGGTCSECGSTDFNFRSTLVPTVEDTVEKDGTNLDSIREKFTKKSMIIRK